MKPKPEAMRLLAWRFVLQYETEDGGGAEVGQGKHLSTISTAGGGCPTEMCRYLLRKLSIENNYY